MRAVYDFKNKEFLGAVYDLRRCTTMDGVDLGRCTTLDGVDLGRCTTMGGIRLGAVYDFGRCRLGAVYDHGRCTRADSRFYIIFLHILIRW